MEWSYCWGWKKGEIPDYVCDYIINNIDHNLYKKGTTSNNNKKFVRNVNIQFSDINWINALLQGYIRYANFANFHYDLSDDDKESAQISRYSEGQYYKLHKDFSPRRLLISSLAHKFILRHSAEIFFQLFVLRNSIVFGIVKYADISFVPCH